MIPAIPKFHPDVHKEVKEAYRYYDSKTAGLGDDFIGELEHGFRMISELPETWPFISGSFRRYLLKRFPYGIIYSTKASGILIVAVMHLSRKPGYWLNRIV